MADKKISALTSSATPLAGTEVLPIVQSGSTVKVAVSDLTAGRAVSALSLTAPDTDATTTITSSGLRVGRGAAFAGGQTELFTVGTRPLGIGTTGAADLSFYTGSTRAFYINTSQNLVVQTAGKGIDFSANTHAAGMTSELLDWYEEGTWTGTLTAATPPTTPITKTGRYTRIGNQITVAIEFDNVDTSGASGAMEVTGLPFAATAAGYGPTMKSGIGTQVITAAVYGGLSKVTFSDSGTMNNTTIVAAAGVYLRFSVTYFV